MSTTLDNSTVWQTRLLWIAVALLGAVAFAIVALNRGEAVNAAWLVTAAVCIYLIAFRFYGLFVANRALGVDGARPTPAYRRNDGSITFRPIDTCCSAIISRQSQAPAHWWARCLRRKWAICPARCGSWPAQCSPARSRI